MGLKNKKLFREPRDMSSKFPVAGEVYYDMECCEYLLGTDEDSLVYLKDGVLVAGENARRTRKDYRVVSPGEAEFGIASGED